MALKLPKPVTALDPKFIRAFGDKAPRTVEPSREPAGPSAPLPVPAHTPPAAPLASAATTVGPRTASTPAKTARPTKGQKQPGVPVDVMIRPLAAQAERIEEAGLPMGPLLQASWRQATAALAITATYVAPSEGDRAQDAHFRTTIRVDPTILDELGRVHDPFGIAGRWSLIRGQVERRFWQAVDDMLERHAQPAPSTRKG